LVVSPYLTLEYVKRIEDVSSSHRIITDLNEWLPSSNRVGEVQDYVEKNSDSVKSVEKLHAKVVSAEDEALLGSANFTRMGMLNRREIAVYIDDPGVIDEIWDWFDIVWSEAGLIDMNEVGEKVEWLEEREKKSDRRRNNSSPSITSQASEVKSKSTFLNERVEDEVESRNINCERDRLIERIKRAPNESWINDYFELADRVLEVTEFSDGSPELVMSLPKSNNKINVTVGHRFVLTCTLSSTPTVGVILPEDTPGIEKTLEENEYWEFEDSRGYSEGEPYYIKFVPSDSPREPMQEIKKHWERAILKEVGRYQRAPRRDKHEPVVYKIAKDFEYRKRILDVAF